MQILLMLLRSVAYTALLAFEILMIARAIFSFLPLSGETAEKIGSFLYMLTEPAIIPVRMFFDKFDFGFFPLDIPFYITFIITSAVSSLLFP